jgi:hypothetical protein
MNVSMPVHTAEPKPEMKQYGFIGVTETLHIYKMYGGGYLVHLAGFQGGRTASKQFPDLDSIKEAFTFIDTPNPALK